MAHHDNPYDGATLKESINKAEELSQEKIEQAFVDKGYGGKEHHPEQTKIYISGKKNLPAPLKKLLKGRSGIEPIIGHLKHEHRLNRNYLLGKLGDKINAIFAGCGFNLRKILNCINDTQECGCVHLLNHVTPPCVLGAFFCYKKLLEKLPLQFHDLF